jgi:hypothetical protein
MLTLGSVALCGVLELYSVALGGNAPPVWFWTSYSVLVVACLLWLKRRSRYAVDWAFVLCAAVFPVAISLWEWDTRKGFTRDLAKIERGMAVQDVDRLMARWIRGSNAPPNPFGGRQVDIVGGGSYEADQSAAGELAVENCEIFRHEDRGNYSSDWGIVCFLEGRVSSVEFAPD